MHNYFVDRKNTPNLRVYTFLLFFSYFFTGANFIITAASNGSGDTTLLRACAVMGILFVVLTPVIILDKRRSNRGILAVVGSITMHGACAVVCSLLETIPYVV